MSCAEHAGAEDQVSQSPKWQSGATDGTAGEFSERSRAWCHKLPICDHCGIRGHIVANCSVDKSVVCYQCGKKGHMRCACRLGKHTGMSRSRTDRD